MGGFGGMGMGPGSPIRSMMKDSSVRDHDLPPGLARRVMAYARPFSGKITGFLVLVLIEASLVVVVPLLLKRIIDDGVVPKDSGLVIRLALLVGALAVLDTVLTVIMRWFSATIGEGLILNLRTQVFGHVLRQPIAFFTHTQTGALVSRLNSDVIGAQQAFTSVMSSVVSNIVSLVLILAAMFSLSWQITLAALVLVPFFLLPARLMGRRLAGLAARQMTLNADLGSRMTERFNVAGALLVKLFGNPVVEEREYAERARRVAETGVKIALNRVAFMSILTLIAAVATAMVYGFGGLMAIDGTLTVGTMLALAALLARLYGPLTSLSNVRVDVMTALVSFERVFEVIDLEPLVAQSPTARALPPGPTSVRFDDVSFTYPGVEEVSLASLEGVMVSDRRRGGQVLHSISFEASPGMLVALVGPSGAGKSTITALVPRLYDPTSGVVSLGGVNLRDATLESISDRVGVVTQEAHLFHDTLAANLRYARPDATLAEIEAACRAAQIQHLIDSLPQGLDTVVGDRGHRLSGGEKQRIAIARLLLKAPEVIVLDEATAHLDSESEAAVQRALDSALAGRTALVIAHRLSTIRGADLILVIADGRIVQRGRHEELVDRPGLYQELYTTQFASQGAVGG